MKVLKCSKHPSERIILQEGIDSPLIPYYCTDVNTIILIGLLRWRLGMKRTAIQKFLRSKGICLSTGTISNRSLDFLLLFKQLHKARKDETIAFFKKIRGIILHVDGTHKSGGEVVFVLQEGTSDIIVNADLIPSEAQDHVSPLLIDFKEQYGSPLVIVRDMAKGIALSASSVFPETPQQICQIHFLRNLEKNLVTNAHKSLKKSIVGQNFTSKIRDLRTVLRTEIPHKNLQNLWVHMAIDYLLHPVVKRAKWLSCPISYYIQYIRIKEISDLINRLIFSNAKNLFVCQSVMELNKFLKQILEDSEVSCNFDQVQRTLGWLNDIRTQLGITRTNHLKDSLPIVANFDATLKDIKNTLDRIVMEGKELGGKYKRIALSIMTSFNNHWDELFVPDPIIDGKRITFKRHNNSLESSHRRIRKSIRERTGNSETNREMEQFGDLLAIISNLWNENYQKEIIGDIYDIARHLGPFVGELSHLRNEYRMVRIGPELPISDNKRKNCLELFVRSLESDRPMEDMMLIFESFFQVGAGAVC